MTALDAITTGDDNIAIGYDSLTNCTEGSGNVAIGVESLKNCTSGSNNVCVGLICGREITTGCTNVIVGDDSHPSAVDANNQIIIGQGITGHGDHIAVIGNTDCTAWHPSIDNNDDLGSSDYRFNNIYYNW